MAANSLKTDDELISDCLVQDELEEIEDSYISATSLARVMRFRAPDRWTIQDENEIKEAGRNESLSRIQDLVRERKLGYVFLECLRLLNYKLKSIEKTLPIKKSILWFVPSAKFAASAISCCSHSRGFPDDRIPYFGHPCCSGVQYCSGDDQFVFRYCPLFRDMDTDLILVFPVEENDKHSLEVAVRGGIERWGTKCTLMVYSALLCGDGLLNSVIINGTTGVNPKLIDHIKSASNPTWLKPSYHKKERALFYQMIWLAKLLVDVRQFIKTKVKSQLLSDLQWEPSLNTSFNESILEHNLSHYKDKSLLKYLKQSRLWIQDDNEPYTGMYPVHKLVRLISSVSTPSLEQELPPLTFHHKSSNEFDCSDIPWFYESLQKSPNASQSLVICGSINQFVPGLTTTQLTKTATDNCCNLSIECILYAK